MFIKLDAKHGYFKVWIKENNYCAKQYDYIILITIFGKGKSLFEMYFFSLKFEKYQNSAQYMNIVFQVNLRISKINFGFFKNFMNVS